MKITIEPTGSDDFEKQVFDNVFEAVVVGTRVCMDTFPSFIRHTHCQKTDSGYQVNDLLALVRGVEESLKDLKNDCTG